MINSRALIIVTFIAGMLVYLVVSLFNIQVLDHNRYQNIARNQQYKMLKYNAERGVIKDRNGESLVFTKDDVSLFVYKKNLSKKGINFISAEFAKLFGKDKNYYLNKIRKGRGSICLEKKADKKIAILLNDINVNGFYKEEDYSRMYPYGKLASHVLGYVNKSFKGVDGIEKEFEEYLRGEDGYLYVEKDSRGRVVSVDYNLSKNPTSGNDIQLTIDKTYQNVLEEGLSWGIEEFGGESATGIIMNPNSGEILALANFPDYEPINYYKFKDNDRKNRAVSDPYEPGSTIKSLVMSMMLTKNKINLKENIDTENGRFRIHGATIRDVHKYKSLTTAEVLQHSSNVGMVKLSSRLENADIYSGFRAFGFGNLTTISLPGESRGLLKSPEKFSKLSKPFMAIGYEVGVTPIQLISAYSALINGGTLYKPLVVKRIINPNGELIEEFKPRVIRKVISEEVSDRIRNLMINVVEDGTGDEARLSNVLVGGKTGTSQKLIDNKYTNKKHYASFIGFLPADNPEFICLIVIDSPVKHYYGGSVAAPVFKYVAEKILNADINLAPNRPNLDRIPRKIETYLASNKKKQVRFYNIDASKKVPKQKVKKLDKMPNLTNYSIREAISVLSKLDIDYEIFGTGKVASQSVKAGTKLSSELKVIINCNNVDGNKGLNLN